MSIIYSVNNYETINNDMIDKLKSNYVITSVKIIFNKIINDKTELDRNLPLFLTNKVNGTYIYIIYDTITYYNNIIEYKCLPFENIDFDIFIVNSEKNNRTNYILELYYPNDDIEKYEFELMYQPTKIYFDNIIPAKFNLNEVMTRNIVSDCYSDLNELKTHLSLYLNTNNIDELILMILKQFNNFGFIENKKYDKINILLKINNEDY